MKKLMTWAMFHTLHWAVLYLAFALHLEGAMYVLKFFVWGLLPLALLFLWDEPAKQAAKSAPTPLRTMLTQLQSWTTLGLLVWHGHIATAIAWALVMALAAFHRERARKFRAEAQPA